MRKTACFAIALVMIVTPMLFSASCAKQTVQTQPVPTTQPEVMKASDRFTDEAGQARRLKEDRLRAEASAQEVARTAFLNENVHFAFDSSELSDQAREILRGKAEYLRANPGARVTIEGHCDERGAGNYNIALGELRAQSARNFLVDLGISANRLSIISYGEEIPMAVGHDEASWAKNRRAQFVAR